MEIKVNGKTVGYYKFGDGKKTLVIIPGIGVRSAVPMGPFVEKAFECFKNEYTAYLIERANVLNDEESVDSIAKDYLEVFDKLKLKDLYIYGASFGGMLCQSIVRQRPELIKKMALASTFAGRTGHKEGIMKWKDLTDKNNPTDLVVNMLKDIYSPNVAAQLHDAMVKDAKSLTDADIKRFKTQLEAIMGFNNTENLKKITCPVLIIAAKGDRLISYKESEYMHEEIKDSELCLYDETMPHAVYDEAKDIPERIYKFFEK